MYDIPEYTIIPSPRRVRAYFNGVAVADSRAMVLYMERPFPNYYFPNADVKMDLLTPSSRREEGDPRGEKIFWNLAVGERSAADIAFTYRNPPTDRQADLNDYITFEFGRMDHWFEEDDEIYVHARNPYHRVDAVRSSRHIVVKVDGKAVAESRQPTLVWETGMPTRYYLPRQDVRLDLLEKSDKHTRCPYKGVAEYFSVKDSDARDLVWSYPVPVAEQPKLEGLMCFYNEAVDIYDDGKLTERAKTHFR